MKNHCGLFLVLGFVFAPLQPVLAYNGSWDNFSRLSFGESYDPEPRYFSTLHTPTRLKLSQIDEYNSARTIYSYILKRIKNYGFDHLSSKELEKLSELIETAKTEAFRKYGIKLTPKDFGMSEDVLLELGLSAEANRVCANRAYVDLRFDENIDVSVFYLRVDNLREEFGRSKALTFEKYEKKVEACIPSVAQYQDALCVLADTTKDAYLEAKKGAAYRRVRNHDQDFHTAILSNLENSTSQYRSAVKRLQKKLGPRFKPTCTVPNQEEIDHLALMNFKDAIDGHTYYLTHESPSEAAASSTRIKALTPEQRQMKLEKANEEAGEYILRSMQRR